MGTSFGGRLALWLAVQLPERIKSLILMSPAAIRPDARPADAPPPAQADSLVAHPERMPPRPPADPAVLAKQTALVMRLSGPPRPEVEQAMQALDVPTLVLFGTSDVVIPPETGRVYRANL